MTQTATLELYLHSEQFWDIELQSFCIQYGKNDKGNKSLSYIKMTETLNVL